MGRPMSEVFLKKFPVNPEDIASLSEEARERILSSLLRSLELAQDDYERNLRPPSDTVMAKAMTE